MRKPVKVDPQFLREWERYSKETRDLVFAFLKDQEEITPAVVTNILVAAFVDLERRIAQIEKAPKTKKAAN